MDIMKRNIKPLSLHLGMALSYWPHAHPDSLHNEKELPEELQNMLLGIKRYQSYDYERPDMPLHDVWEQGQARLLTTHKNGLDSDRPVLLLVPSLVNKSYILDLLPELSLLRWLQGQGMNVVLLDWGDIAQDSKAQTLDDIVSKKLHAAIDFLCAQTGGPIHTFGYCMGGTLLLGAVQERQDKIKSCTFLATPWNFHGGSQALLRRVEFWAGSALQAIQEKNILPEDYLQVLFASLDPEFTAMKFAKFAAMEDRSEEEVFVSVEDWLNDGVALPPAVGLSCIQDWFIGNETGRGEWSIAGKAVQPQGVNIPCLVIASDHDRLVEFENAKVLYDALPDAELLNPACGHIGMIVGRRAKQEVWEPMHGWLQKQV